ncbi:MAG: dockerin type I repeat-containing protein [Firmicutes bacterium]|nr:dockerin type I repeat-containing protein [Bacillota bacterium]
MGRIKKIITVIFAVMAVLLMQISVFAYTGSGSESSPYIVKEGSELVELTKYSGERWIRIANDITIDEETGNLNPEGTKHIDLGGHTITVDYFLFIYIYASATSTSCELEMKNGSIVMDAPERNDGHPALLMYMPRGNVIFRDMTIDATLRDKGSVILRNYNYGDFQTNGVLELYNCTINDHSQCQTTAIQSRASFKMVNTTVTCDNTNSYAFTIMGSSNCFDMINSKLTGKISIEDRDGDEDRKERYINNWISETEKGAVIIGTEDKENARIVSVNYNKPIPYGEYVAESYPTIDISATNPESETCGQPLFYKLEFYHADDIKWYIAARIGEQTIPRDIDSFDVKYYTSKSQSPYGFYDAALTIPNVGEEYDGLWICAEVSDGYKEKTTEWYEIVVTKATVKSLTLYDLVPPTQGVEPVDTDVTFSKEMTQCIDDADVGFYYKIPDQPVVHPKAGQEYYVYLSIALKEKYAAFAQDANGKPIVSLKWNGVDMSEFEEIRRQYIDLTDVTVVYRGVVPTANGDINADGNIDDIDAALLLRHISGTKLLTDEELKRADMDGNKKYNMLDVIAVLNKEN